MRETRTSLTSSLNTSLINGRLSFYGPHIAIEIFTARNRSR